MNTHTAITKKVTEHRIAIREDESMYGVTLDIVETINGEITGKGSIELSKEGFLTLLDATLCDMGYTITRNMEVI